MKSPNVCTASATHRRIVSEILNPLGAMPTFVSLSPQSSGRLQRLPSPEHSQVLDLILFSLIYSLTAGSDFPVRIQKSKIKNIHRTPDFLRNFEIFDFHFQTKNPPLKFPNSCCPCGSHQNARTDFCTKLTISHKITQCDLLLKQLSTKHLSLTISYPLPHPHVQKPIRQKPISNFPIRSPLRLVVSSGGARHP
jgi:hypothetical protein